MEENLAGAHVVMWSCPDIDHETRVNDLGQRAPTVEWVGEVAHCLTPGCTYTSENTVLLRLALRQLCLAVQTDKRRVYRGVVADARAAGANDKLIGQWYTFGTQLRRGQPPVSFDVKGVLR